MPFQNQLTREEVMLIFIKILAVRKQQKQFKYQAGIFFLLEEFFGALLCILVPTTPEPKGSHFYHWPEKKGQT